MARRKTFNTNLLRWRSGKWSNLVLACQQSLTKQLVPIENLERSQMARAKIFPHQFLHDNYRYQRKLLTGVPQQSQSPCHDKAPTRLIRRITVTLRKATTTPDTTSTYPAYIALANKLHRIDYSRQKRNRPSPRSPTTPTTRPRHPVLA